MKTIGLLGGMSWESTALYYRLINEGVKKSVGGLNSAKIALVSVNFKEIEILQNANRWEDAGVFLAGAARQVEAAGADFLLICTNTMHKVFDPIKRAIEIPILHIADATAQKIKTLGIKTVGLLGTKFTMEEEFYMGRLIDVHGLDVLLPSENDRNEVHRIIYEELCLGIIRDESREEIIRMINQMRDRGAEGVIEGCTEIVTLVKQQHTDVPLFDTTALHAEAAVLEALE